MKNLNKDNQLIFLKNSYVFDLYDASNKIKKNKNVFEKHYDYYLYSFFLKKIYFSLCSNEHKKKNLLFKNNVHTFLKNSLKFGNKLKTLKSLNFMRFQFFLLFSKKHDFFQKKFPTYSIFYSFSKTEKRFFDLDFLISLVCKNNESVFQTKAVRLNKKTKQKNKTKSRYSLDFQYLKPSKRRIFVVKQIHLFSNYYNFYTYGERLLMSFLNVFFLDKNSDIYKNKASVYKNILKKNSNF